MILLHLLTNTRKRHVHATACRGNAAGRAVLPVTPCQAPECKACCASTAGLAALPALLNSRGRNGKKLSTVSLNPSLRNSYAYYKAT